MEENTGFLLRPTAIPNQIKTLLKERYKEGFPIIKENIQNANDGGATRLDIGVTRGLSGANHPLLQCPALFFVNDGDFSDSEPIVSWQKGCVTLAILHPQAKLYLAANTWALNSPISELWKFCLGMFLGSTTSKSTIVQDAVLVVFDSISNISRAIAPIIQPPVPPAPTTTKWTRARSAES